ncbi:MAG TPA: universal stress protein, partial [Blastocatellia bacterium]|nr:universal stress protein [Blastocatellia bacterium]
MTNRMRVIVAYDGSECADAALDDLWSAGLPDDTQFKVLSVLEHWLPPPSGLEVVEHIDYHDEYKALAARAVARLRSMRPSWEVDAEVCSGSAATAIIEKADEWKPDLLVVGSHGRTALGRFFFGSVSQKLSHDAHCSVRVSRGRVKEPGAPVRLIVGVDGSKGAEVAVRSAASREWPKGSEVRVVNASWTVPNLTPPLASGPIINWFHEENARVKTAVDGAVARLNDIGLRAESVIEEGLPKEVLV